MEGWWIRRFRLMFMGTKVLHMQDMGLGLGLDREANCGIGWMGQDFIALGLWKCIQLENGYGHLLSSSGGFGCAVLNLRTSSWLVPDLAIRGRKFKQALGCF